MLIWIKRIVLFVLAIASIYLGVVFTSENSQPVSIIFFGGNLGEWALGLWVLIVLLSGLVSGMALTSAPLLWSRARKQRRIRQLERQLNQIQNSENNKE